jgi:predicted MFS family arabinose efflux permease
VLLVAFVALQRRLADPMLDLTLFRKPAFAGAAIAAFALSASMFSMFLYLTLYLQNQLGYGPLETGLRFLPVTLLSFFVAPVAGRLSARMPVRFLLGGGLALVGIGLLLMRGVEPGSDWTALLAGFLFAGAGIGMVNPPLASTAVGVVDPARSGMASGINSTFRQVGIATGIAGLGALFQARIEVDVPGFAGDNAGAGEILSSIPLADVPAPFRAAVQASFTGALNDILLVAAAIAFAGALLSLALVRQQDFVTAPQNP